MSRVSVSVSVSPAVLKWVRLYTKELRRDAAQKIKVTEEILEAWEEGIQKPNLTLTQLEALSNFYKCPLATFLLPKPPTKLPEFEDFRTLYGEEGKPLSREVRLMIREARWFQFAAAELAEKLGKDIKPAIGETTTRYDPELLAFKERERLGVSIKQQLAWANNRTALKEWRRSVEKLNVLVFQLSLTFEKGLRLRGFSLADELPLAIVINSKESVNARIFSLFHEYAHLLLHVSGICDTNIENPERVEVFCNNFAGAFLVSSQALLDHRLVKKHVDSYFWAEEDLETLSEEFKVSREVILRRLLKCDKVAPSFYEDWRKNQVFDGGGSGWASPKISPIIRRGLTLSSYIVNAYGKNLISSLDAADYLGISVKRIPDVSRELRKQIE